MKILIFILSLFLLPSISYSQVCSANAGGDQTICVGDLMILYGEDSDLYQDPLVVHWTSLSNPNFLIANPHALQTSVSPPSGSSTFTPGDYEFELCVICQDGVETCNIVTISVGEINTPATLLPHNTQICENTITLQGSTPDPGATVTWIVNPVQGLNIVQNGTELTLTHVSNTVCSYTVKYIISLGTCESSTGTELVFTKSYSSVFAGNDGTVCGFATTVCGTIPGCGGTPEWTVASTPSGGVATVSNPNARCTGLSVNMAGEYCFDYTIENGTCPTATDQVCLTFQEGEGIDLGPDVEYVFCADEWDLATWDLAAPNIAGATYSWTAFSSMGSGWISFSSPNAYATTVSFAGTPVDISEDGLLLVICVTATAGECGDTKCYRVRANPTVEVSAETVTLICGGDPHFMPSDYISTGSGGGNLSGTFVNPPAGSPYSDGDQFPINSTSELNLTSPGIYTLAVLITSNGIDPVSGEFVTCRDEATLTVVVADIPTINAGSDILTCATTIELNGSTPLDVNGNVVNIPVLWEQIGGPAGATILSPNASNSLVTGLDYNQTYTFQYSFSKDPDCYLVDEMTVTIKPQGECCELEVVVKQECFEGCVTLNVEGADSYLWAPSNGIDDPSSSTPEICNNAGGIYTVYGISNGEVCGSALVELDPCAGAPLDCDGYTVDAHCAQCGCGALFGSFKAYDSNGMLVDPTETEINWTIDDLYYSDINNFTVDYYGLIVWSVHIVYTDDTGQIVCDTTIAGTIVCGSDCPNFQVVTCGDPLLPANLEQCGASSPNLCTDGSGYVYLLDDSGSIVTDYIIDWGNDGSIDSNPYMVNGLDACGPLTVRVWSWGGCDVTFDYEISCCDQQAPVIECAEPAERGQWPLITWDGVCGTAYYEVQLACVSGASGYSEVYYVYNNNGAGLYTFDPNVFSESACDIVIARVRAFCSASESFGDFSNCLWVEYDFCFDIVGEGGGCEEYFFNLSAGGGGRERGEERITSRNDVEKIFSLFPNPAQDEVSLQLGAIADTRIEVKVQDVNGKVWIAQKWENPQMEQKISTNALPTGVYLVSVFGDQGQWIQSERLVKIGGQ